MGNNGKGLAVAGLVLSIVGLVFSFLGGWFSVLALPLSIVGLVLAVVGGKKLKAVGAPAGIATAGLVLGIIAVVFSAIFFFTCGICTLCVAAKLNEGLNDLNNDLNNSLNDLNDLANQLGGF
ncbi:MAG: hypothetical protein IJW27_07545 [Clostridia bacterium]|nr:hypothetical protein [Clostridia bacterium]